MHARRLAAAVLAASVVAIPGAARAHVADPFVAGVKSVTYTSPTSVKALMRVANYSKHAKRARCTAVAYSGAQGMSEHDTVGMRVPPYLGQNKYAVAEEWVRFQFPQGPIKPVGITVQHCHRV